MRVVTAVALSAALAVAAIVAVAAPPWHAPIESVQTGPDGQAMLQFATRSPWRIAPAPQNADAPAAEGGAAATATYKNVKVLTDISDAEFMRLQTAMTNWVSPKQGCAFCHVAGDFVSDANPMKDATRDMLRMTRYLNTRWSNHVGSAGVTCFSCHRGEPVPPETWFPASAKIAHGMTARAENWNEAADTVRAFFPDNGWALYLLHDEPIRAESKTDLRGNTVASQYEVKRVYEMMMQMSDGIGVNCGYCHHSRAFSDWTQSTPARWIGHDAIRMMRDINVNFLLHLRDTLPQTREATKENMLSVPREERGAHDGFGLAVCAQCHYGSPKPQDGAATLANYRALGTSVNAQPLNPGTIVPVRDRGER